MVSYNVSRGAMSGPSLMIGVEFMAKQDDSAAALAGPQPPFTINEFADLHGVARSVVRKWIARGQVPSKRIGGKTARAAAVLVLTAERPPRLAPGSLTPEQRGAWKKAGPKKA